MIWENWFSKWTITDGIRYYDGQALVDYQDIDEATADVDYSQSARIPLKEKDVLYGEFSQQTTYQLVKEMLESGDYPRAFFLSNNLSEAGFLQAVTEKGLRIPENIAFVSFDKISNQEIFNLPFSYLERNIQDLGEQAARLLVRRFNDPDGPQQRVVVMSKVALLGSEKKIE